MGKSLAELMRDYERLIVLQTLQRNGNDRPKAAAALKITRRGLDKILSRNNISKRRYTRPLPIPPSKE